MKYNVTENAFLVQFTGSPMKKESCDYCVSVRKCIYARQTEKTYLSVLVFPPVRPTVWLSLSVCLPIHLQPVCPYRLIRYVSPYSGFTSRDFSNNKYQYIHLFIKSF